MQTGRTYPHVMRIASHIMPVSETLSQHHLDLCFMFVPYYIMTWHLRIWFCCYFLCFEYDLVSLSPLGQRWFERVSHWVLIHLWVLCARVFVQVLPGTQLFRFCLFTFLQSSYIAFFAPCTFWYVISKEVPGQLWAHSWSCILESLYRILGYSCRI